MIVLNFYVWVKFSAHLSIYNRKQFGNQTVYLYKRNPRHMALALELDGTWKVESHLGNC